jgi:acylphosphatase
MKTLRIFITGTVQGVFFRRYIKEKADLLHVRGYVRNLEDKRVEVLAEGLDDNVKELLEYCKQGPPHSKIKHVEINEINHQNFKDFRVVKI